MQRPAVWLMLVVLLLGLLFVREPRLERSEQLFLRWLLRNSQPRGPMAPLTVVEIGKDEGSGKDPLKELSPSHPGGTAVSPLEFALFLQSILEFEPTVVAFENILKWHERDKDQEQVLIDQAMKVPKLLLAAELITATDPDAPTEEVTTFSQVTGNRGNLVEFSGIGRRPSEEVGLIGTTGFINLPEQVADGIHVPLLFLYRGEVVPSFVLQAALFWLRVTPAEVKIDLGSQISLPQGRTIPIQSDGTLLISPNAAKKARRITLNELALATQQHDAGQKSELGLESVRDQIVLARTPTNPLSPPDVFAATLATIQTNNYVHRISWVFDCVFLVVATALVIGKLRHMSRFDLILIALAFTAAYCLIAVAIISRWLVWLPGCLPLGAFWLLVLISILMPRRVVAQQLPESTIPPAVP